MIVCYYTSILSEIAAGTLRRVTFRVTFYAVSCDFTHFQRHTRSYSRLRDDTKNRVTAGFLSRYAVLSLAEKEGFERVSIRYKTSYLRAFCIANTTRVHAVCIFNISERARVEAGVALFGKC